MAMLSNKRVYVVVSRKLNSRTSIRLRWDVFGLPKNMVSDIAMLWTSLNTRIALSKIRSASGQSMSEWSSLLAQTAPGHPQPLEVNKAAGNSWSQATAWQHLKPLFLSADVATISEVQKCYKVHKVQCQWNPRCSKNSCGQSDKNASKQPQEFNCINHSKNKKAVFLGESS